ncbi:spermatogenesis-associated protein 31A6-like [Vicugna pacos]|uniref:Spermatogenesis-associated protein 31A6-like n=1 Tax=Vicugna pacos TaxID=30538 RepID=A0A6J0B4E5_VICPA
MQTGGFALLQTPSAPLPEGNRAVQKMENLFSLNSVIATWLSSSPTSWVTDTIFAVLCGLGLFLLLLPCLPGSPSLPPPRKQRNIKKHQVQPKGRSRNRKKGGALKACRDYLQELESTRNMVSLLQSRIGKLPDKGSFHQPSRQDPSGEVCKAVPAGAHQLCGEPVEEAAPAMSPMAPLTTHPPPLASSNSPGSTTSSVSVHPHTLLSSFQPSLPPDSPSPWPVAPPPPLPCPPDSEGCPPPLTAPALPNSILTLPLGTVPQSMSPHTPWSASLAPGISGLGHSSCPTSALSRWQAAAKALCPATSSQCEPQKKHLSHDPPKASFLGSPTDRQTEASRPSLLSSDDQKLPEIQITKTVEIKIWKEKEKHESYLKRMSPDRHLNSSGNMLKSLDAEQDTTPSQLPGPPQLSYPSVLGNHLQQKYNQLFWGLPSLHSESLVATAWISESPSAPQSPSFLFNGILNACPVQMQAKTSPLLSQSQPLFHLEFQARPFIPTMPQFQPPPLARVQTQVHPQSSLPIQPPSSPPQIRPREVSYPTAQYNPQSFNPTEVQPSEWCLLQKQLDECSLCSGVKKPQEAFNVFTSNLSEDSWAVSILPKNFPISPELRKQLEQHLQKWLIQHRWELPQRIQESLETRQLQGELPGMCEAKGQHGPSRPSSLTGESSKDAQKVGFQLSQDLGQGLGHILGEVPEDPSRSSGSSRVKFYGVNPEESESDLRLLRNDSGIDLLRRLDKNLENILKGPLGKNLGQISEGLRPGNVCQSWLALNHASPKSDTHMETRNLGVLKGWKPYVNTSRRVSFLDPDIRKMLDTHVKRFWVKHRWGLPLKILQLINFFKSKKTQPSPIQQVSFYPSATCVSGAHSTVKFAEFLGKPPQADLVKKVITEKSISSLVRPLLAPSLVCEEIQRTVEWIPSGDHYGPPKASLTEQEGKPPSQSLTRRLVGRIWKRETVEGAKRDSLESHLSSAKARNEPREESGGQASRDSSHRVTMLGVNLGSQSLGAEEAREAVEAKKLSALQPQPRGISGTNTLTNPQTTNVPMGSVEALGTRKISLLPRMSVFRHPGEPGLSTEVVSDYTPKVEVQSDSQLQDGPKHMSPIADNLASQGPQCHSQTVPTGDRLASRVLSGFTKTQRSGQGQEKPKTSKLQDLRKSQSKTPAPADEREDSLRPKPGAHEEGCKESGTSQAGSVSRPAQVRGMISPFGRKYLQVTPEKKQGPTESFFKNRLRLFFQWIFSRKKIKGWDFPQRCKPVPATTRSQAPVKSRSILNTETTEAQALMTALGQILEEKMAVHHGLHATKLEAHKPELQAPAWGRFCYHRLPCYQKQERMLSYTACSHQATSKDRGGSTRESEVTPQQFLKSVRFSNEQLGLRCRPSLPLKNTLSPVSPCQHGPRVSGAPAPRPHCPRHCPRGGALSGQP